MINEGRVNPANPTTYSPPQTIQQRVNLSAVHAQKRRAQSEQSRDDDPKICQISYSRNRNIDTPDFQTLDVGIPGVGRVEQNQDNIEDSNGGQDVIGELIGWDGEAGNRTGDV